MTVYEIDQSAFALLLENRPPRNSPKVCPDVLRGPQPLSREVRNVSGMHMYFAKPYTPFFTTGYPRALALPDDRHR